MKFAVVLAACAAFGSTAASAADLAGKTPPPVAPVSADGFDYAFGGKVFSDYIFRGITQTDHSPGGTAYGELRYNLGDTQFYAGVQPWTVKLPTDPSAEVDLYGGIRQTYGAFAADFGALYYLYPDNTRRYFVDAAGNTALASFPGGVPTTSRDVSYFEGYVKPTYTINDMFTVGANVYYSPNFQALGTDGKYVSGTVKITLPQNFSVSGEFGRQFIGTSNAELGFTRYFDYNTWNVGVSYTYKVFTLDVRYSDTDLNKNQCYVNTSDPNGNRLGQIASFRSNWCDQRVVATLSFDLASKDLK